MSARISMSQNSVDTGGTSPHVVIAESMGPHPAPLGLDAPLALLGGGDRLMPGGMASALGIDHVRGLRTFMAEACRSQVLAGRDWYQQPPLALLGQHGVGKGFAARWIARHAGLPLFRMPVTYDFAANQPDSDGVEMRLPAVPLIAMAASRCANPIVVVELDVDHPPEGVALEELVRMLDPRRNERWLDKAQDAIFDLGHISWIVQVHGRPQPRGGVHDPNASRGITAALPPLLADLIKDVGLILRIGPPSELEDMRRLDVAVEICASHAAADRLAIAAVNGHLLEIRRERIDHLPCGSLVREAERALASHLARSKG